MGDPLWTSMAGNNFVRREQLELVVQKKKLTEVSNWFNEHFVTSSNEEYLTRCPIVILQGPTGCGKTSTLKWISNELIIPIKEYSETTDTISLNYDLGRMDKDEESSNLSHQIDLRKAEKFERFCIHSMRYNTLYPTTTEIEIAEEVSEFESSSESIVSSPKTKPSKAVGGIIIHIDTLISFAKSQRILINTLCRLLKVIRQISPYLMRRVAIVFETLEGDNDIISLSSKTKNSLRITVFKFNPIIRANMKKLVESLIKDLKHVVISKDTIEQLVGDCDGDIRACINTLQLICNKSPGNHVFKQIDHNSINSNDVIPYKFYHQASKKQKLMSEKVRQVVLNPSLMRDNTRSSSFFHVLGKIFYQKRLYPDPSITHTRQSRRYRSVDRPYPTENSTDHLVNLLSVEPSNLITWLHQHYYKFCSDTNIDKAALFLENLSAADTTSINSTQSSQFYETHNAIDQLQIHLAIESTVFSLYEDQSGLIKSNCKKTSTDLGSKLVKSSVENFNPNTSELYSFNKPVSMNLNKLVGDYQSLLSLCRAELIEINSKSIDPLKVLLDYVPYMNHLSKNWATTPPGVKAKLYPDASAIQVYEDDQKMRLFRTLEKLEEEPDLDLETRHEKLMEMIEDAEFRDHANQTNMPYPLLD